jgi:hypothetical protein
MLKHLPSKHKALSLNPSTTRKNRKLKRKFFPKSMKILSHASFVKNRSTFHKGNKIEYAQFPLLLGGTSV